jgi:hypothetical protein
MTKVKKKSSGTGGSFQGGLTNLIREAKKMQHKIEKLKDELKIEEYFGEAGDGEAIIIKATVNGDLELKNIEISEAAYKEDKEMINDLIITAVNKAIKESQSKKDSEMNGITSGFSFPGLF